VSNVTAAMIMGAGLGLRMRPLTDDRPKPLVTVGGKSLIDHSIDRLAAAGVRLVVVNVHYKAEMLRSHLSRRRDVEIVFSDETGQLLDTGGGVVKAMPYFGNASFFVINSDSIWVENTPALPAMLAQWDENRMDGLLLLADMPTAIGYDAQGDFILRPDHRVVRARGNSGAAFIVILPIFLSQFLPAVAGLFGVNVSTETGSHAELIVFGALIVWFLIVEPHGLAKLWSTGKQKLRLWPFPH